MSVPQALALVPALLVLTVMASSALYTGWKLWRELDQVPDDHPAPEEGSLVLVLPRSQADLVRRASERSGQTPVLWSRVALDRACVDALRAQTRPTPPERTPGV